MTSSQDLNQQARSTESMPVPSVSLGLGNDLDPKFARYLFPVASQDFGLGCQLSRGDAGHGLFHQRGPTQVITLIMEVCSRGF